MKVLVLILAVSAIAGQAQAANKNPEPASLAKAQEYLTRTNDYYVATLQGQFSKREALVKALKNEVVYRCSRIEMNDKAALVKVKVTP